MKKFYKTFLASLLAAAMVVTSVPAEILAAPADEIVEEEVTVAEPSDAVVSDAAVVEEEVGEVDPVDPDDYVNDVPLVIAGTRTNLALVIRGGDHISAPIENATHVALDENDEVTGLNSGGDTVYSAFIDSSQGVTGYVVPKYGYSLPSDLKVTVTGSYQGPETTVTYHAITSNDWSKTTKSGLDYLDDPDGYEWGKAVEINIPASTWLTSYMEAGASKQNKPIALTVDGEATVNKASFSVTVDGVQKATDYKTNITTTHSTAISITNSVKAKDLDRYDVVAGIYDGDELVTEIHEGVGSISTDDEDVEFFLSGDGDIFFTTAAYKAMYQAKHEHGYKTVVALTTRADALTQYSVVLDDATYVKSVKAGATGGGDAITTAAGKVTSDGASDVIFKVTPKDNVTVTGVKYFIEGMSAPISAIGYDATHGVFDGETYVATPAVYDDGAVLTEGTSLTSNTYYEKDGDVYFPTEDEEADGTTRYYLVTTLAETAVGSATSMVYGIPYDEDLHEAAALETHVGAITLYIETENTVTFTLPYSASDNTALASIVTSVTDNGLDTSEEYTIVAGTTEVWNGTDEYQKNTQTVAGGKEYTFTITPDNDHKIKSVTAKMPAVPGAAAAPVDLGDGTFGKYKIAKVTGYVSIEVVLQDNDTNIDVQTASAPSNYTVKEVSTGAIVNNSTVKNAKSGDDYTFAVTPDGGYYVSRVSLKT